MSDTPEDQPTRPISVAELLARHGNIGSPPVTGRKRRRRGNADAVSVAELTGEIPVIRDPDDPEAPEDAETAEDAVEDGAEGAEETPADEAAPAARPAAAASDQREDPVRFSEPQPRWPQSAPHAPGKTGPQRSPHPLPDRKADRGGDRSEGGSDAEQMSPDPVDVFPAVSMADLGPGADPDEDLLDTVDDGPPDAAAPARPAAGGSARCAAGSPVPPAAPTSRATMRRRRRPTTARETPRPPRAPPRCWTRPPSPLRAARAPRSGALPTGTPTGTATGTATGTPTGTPTRTPRSTTATPRRAPGTTSATSRRRSRFSPGWPAGSGGWRSRCWRSCSGRGCSSPSTSSGGGTAWWRWC